MLIGVSEGVSEGVRGWVRGCQTMFLPNIEQRALID